MKQMTKIWAIAVGLLGAQSLYKITINTDGAEVGIPIVPIILILMPVFMIGSNIINRLKKKQS